MLYLQPQWCLIGIYSAAVGEMRELNSSAQAQNEPPELRLSLLRFILERPVREENILTETVFGIIYV